MLLVAPLIPMEKLIRPEDIADTILFLASEKAGMLTGQVIIVQQIEFSSKYEYN